MDAERARVFLLGLPHVVETAQWDGVVFWVGDKAVGGKMFVMLNPDGGMLPKELPISWPVGPERYAEMLEIEGLVPAPYFARIFWVSAERWGALGHRAWEEQLGAAHALVLEKLPKKVRTTLELPRAELKRVVVERRKLLAEKAAAKKG